MMINHDHEMGYIYIMQIYYEGVLFLSHIMNSIRLRKYSGELFLS